ncbi:MAG: hypothetical protein AB8G17_12965 [Gammaproteobacteria bacterium]
MIPVAMHLNPIEEGSALSFQTVTGDPRLNDQGQISLHGNIYSASVGGAKEMTLSRADQNAPPAAFDNYQRAQIQIAIA